MNIIRQVFLSRHSELRTGWRVLLYLLLSSAFGLALIVPVSALQIRSQLLATALLLVALLGATFIMTRFVNRKPFRAVGLWLRPRFGREWGMGLLLGFLMMGGIFVVQVALGFAQPVWRGLPVLEVLGILGHAALVFLIAAGIEEVLFRGYPFQTVVQGITFLPAMFLFAVLFSLAHWANPNVAPFGLLNIALAGIWLSFAYMKTRSLWFPTALHCSWNFSQSTLFGFPTSGTGPGDLTLIDLVQSGPDWLTGGAFGPEGGVLATVALAVGTAFIMKSPLFNAPEGVVTLDSLEDLLPPSPAQEERAV